MARTCVIALLVAAAWTALPAHATAQRLVTYQPGVSRDAPSALPRLRLAATAPVRVSWRPSEVALAGAFTAALLIDAAQTRRLAAGGWRDHVETNPILGRRPSVGQLNTYTAVAGLAVLGVAAAAPKRARPWLLGVALAAEACALVAVSRAGVAIRIP
jgi:hypothetical protein